MGKQGPCYHCGVTSTPLWRNGPPDKPVLCNACGSRWRTKGTLANYTPLHARLDPVAYEDHRASREKTLPTNKNKEVKLLKRKLTHENVVTGASAADYNLGQNKVFDEDSSNRSSSGSAISNSESIAQFGSTEASELTGPGQSLCGSGTQAVPSKKRTSGNHPKQSPFEKLSRDLYTIWQEQQHSSCFSVISEEDLLFDDDKPMVSVEIGHGSVLISHPSSNRDDESEASSTSVEKKRSSTNEAYSHSHISPVQSENKIVGLPYPAIDKAKTTFGQDTHQELVKREHLHEKVQVLESHNSPLCTIDLNDVFNFTEFIKLLTSEEQQRLHRFLLSIDTAKSPDSIKNLFDSPEFKENISMYQQLLAEGVFDLSFSGAKVEDCKKLRSFALSNLSKCKWMEHYNFVKNHRIRLERPAVGKESDVKTSKYLVSLKRSRDSQSQEVPEVKTMKIPKRITIKTSENKENKDNNGSCFSPKSLFAFPQDGSSLMMDPVQFVDESSDQDLLLDVPSSGSFLQAELLHPTHIYHQLGSTSSSAYPH